MQSSIAVTKLPRGQALVEFALVFPLFIVLVFGIVLFGIGVFYQQEVTNAAREAARFAAVSSASNIKCPVVGHLDPAGPEPWLTTTDPNTGKVAQWPHDLSYTRCDTPAQEWPRMTAAARSKLFGLDVTDVILAACWSGYQSDTHYDAPPPGSAAAAGVPVAWAPCTIDGVDPIENSSAIKCKAGDSSNDYVTVDTASSISDGQGRTVANRVSAYVCYPWHPPLGGIEIDWFGTNITIIPAAIPLRAVVSEAIQRQQ